MSDKSGITEAEALEIFGAPVASVPPDENELAVSLLVGQFRTALTDAVAEDKVGVNELADRLEVSPSVVSRSLRSDGDMRVSTCALWARALGREWDVKLRKVGARDGANQHWSLTTEMRPGSGHIQTSGTATIFPTMYLGVAASLRSIEIVTDQ